MSFTRPYSDFVQVAIIIIITTAGSYKHVKKCFASCTCYRDIWKLSSGPLVIRVSESNLALSLAFFAPRIP